MDQEEQGAQGGDTTAQEAQVCGPEGDSPTAFSSMAQGAGSAEFYNRDIVQRNTVQDPPPATDAPGQEPGPNNPHVNPMSEAYQHGLKDGQRHAAKYCYVSAADEENYEAGYAAGEGSGATPASDQPAPGPAVTGGTPAGGVPLSQIEDEQCRTAEWAMGRDGHPKQLPCSTENHGHDPHPNPQEEEEAVDRIRNAGEGESHTPAITPVETVPEMPPIAP
jgi:hypothetical protein